CQATRTTQQRATADRAAPAPVQHRGDRRAAHPLPADGGRPGDARARRPQGRRLPSLEAGRPAEPKEPRAPRVAGPDRSRSRVGAFEPGFGLCGRPSRSSERFLPRSPLTMPEIHWAAAAVYVADLLIRVGLSLRIIRRRLPVGVALAWLSVVLIFPFAGACVYLLIGESRLGRRRARGAAALRPSCRPWAKER